MAESWKEECEAFAQQVLDAIPVLVFSIPELAGPSHCDEEYPLAWLGTCWALGWNNLEVAGGPDCSLVDCEMEVNSTLEKATKGRYSISIGDIEPDNVYVTDLEGAVER